jgi:CRISPR-associated protein Csx16
MGIARGDAKVGRFGSRCRIGKFAVMRRTLDAASLRFVRRVHPSATLSTMNTDTPLSSPRRWLVSRHPGAQCWLARLGLEATVLAHLDPGQVSPGDEVYGTLPLHLAAAVCDRGARFFYLALDVPASLRGQEIDPETMAALGARLEEFIVRRADDPRAVVD